MMEIIDNRFRDEKENVKRVFKDNNLHFSEVHYQKLEEYLKFIFAWNKKVNLFSRKENHPWTQLIFHSLSFLAIASLPAKVRIIDIGTGAGLPGIPLACVRPDLVLTLIDSIGKKIRAVKDIAHELKVDLTVINTRAEDLALSHAALFDYAIARAVAPLDQLSQWAHPLLQHHNITPQADTVPQGTLLALKGGSIEEEVRNTEKKPFVEKVDIYPILLKNSELIENKEKFLAVVHFKY